MARQQYRINLNDEEHENLIARAKVEFPNKRQGLLSLYIRFLAKNPHFFCSKKDLIELIKSQTTKNI